MRHLNYIQKLQQENERLHQALLAVRSELNRMRCYVESDKFKTQEGGERKDWIATGDIARWTDDVRMMTFYD